MPDSNFLGTLRAIREARVEFVLVGGLAAVLNGAPIHTYDVDIVPSPDEENLGKLLCVLGRSPGLKNLVTTYGPLDVLGTIGRGLGYEDLLPHTIEMEIGEGTRVRVLDLATIITLKEELAGEKEFAVLPILRRTLEQKRRLNQG